LVLIIGIGIFFRFYRLTEVPPPLSHDETAIGYNAYSILKTGKDEYGTSYPLLFRSFDDYKLPGMVYSTVIPVWIFGLNELSVRLPSAIYGVLAIIVFYFICREFLSQTPVYKKTDTYLLSVLMTGFFSLSLWHINFSRQCFESNGAVFFLMLATLFLIRFPARPKSLIMAAVFYAVSIYFYYSVRLIIPFILLAFLISKWRDIRVNRGSAIISVLCGIITIAPMIPSLISPGGFERIRMVSVTNDPVYLRMAEGFSRKTAENNSPINRLIYNRRAALILTVLDNYRKNISYDQLFTKGAGRTGLLHKFEFPLLIVGLFVLFRIKSPLKWILAAWLLSSPLPGAFSVNQPNALRTLPGAPIFAFISGLGFISIYNLFKSKTAVIAQIIMILVLYLISLTQFFDSYFNKFPTDNPLGFADGQKQMVSYVQSERSNYRKIIISGYYWRPYIFTLFWLKYDPQAYQSAGKISGFDKFVFGRSGWDTNGILFFDPGTDIVNLSEDPDNTLYILAPADYDAHKSQFRIIKGINGMYAKSAFYAARALN
jgi:4-amino-4-deoxy-L-arabinose transferase-like glycosyltransferase